jgi:hypothetical protein
MPRFSSTRKSLTPAICSLDGEPELPVCGDSPAADLCVRPPEREPALEVAECDRLGDGCPAHWLSTKPDSLTFKLLTLSATTPHCPLLSKVHTSMSTAATSEISTPDMRALTTFVRATAAFLSFCRTIQGRLPRWASSTDDVVYQMRKLLESASV